MGAFRDIATCIFCKSKRTVAHKEWIRASRPRCLNCGGPLEISEGSRHWKPFKISCRLAFQWADGLLG